MNEKNPIENYNSDFKEKIKERGMNLYLNNKIENFTKNNNKYECIINGAKKYHVFVEFGDDFECLDDYECDCTYYDQEDNFCKHIYALLCKIFNVPFKINKNLYSLDDYKNMSKKEIIQEFLEGNLDIDDIDELGYDFETINNDNEIINNSDIANHNEKYLISQLDDDFEEKIRKKGLSLYSNNKVSSIKREGNKYSAIVQGKKNYEVYIEYSDIRKDNLDDWNCECAYALEEGELCEHIYALVCASYNLPKLEKNIVNDDNSLKKLSKQEIINKIKNKELSLSDLEVIDYEYDELFPEDDNDPLIKYLDEFISSMPIEVLRKVREIDIENGEDTEIIDNAIKERLRKDSIIREEQLKMQRIQEEEDKKWNKRYKKAALLGFLGGLISGLNDFNKLNNNNDYNPMEQELINKGEYEPYHFEEEELDEDDFYSDDLD